MENTNIIMHDDLIIFFKQNGFTQTEVDFCINLFKKIDYHNRQNLMAVLIDQPNLIPVFKSLLRQKIDYLKTGHKEKLDEILKKEQKMSDLLNTEFENKANAK